MANYIMSIVQLLLGTLWVYCAAIDFKKEKWWGFALDVMCTVWSITHLVYYLIMIQMS